MPQQICICSVYKILFLVCCCFDVIYTCYPDNGKISLIWLRWKGFKYKGGRRIPSFSNLNGHLALCIQVTGLSTQGATLTWNGPGVLVVGVVQHQDLVAHRGGVKGQLSSRRNQPSLDEAQDALPRIILRDGRGCELVSRSNKRTGQWEKDNLKILYAHCMSPSSHGVRKPDIRFWNINFKRHFKKHQLSSTSRILYDPIAWGHYTRHWCINRLHIRMWSSHTWGHYTRHWRIKVKVQGF